MRYIAKSCLETIDKYISIPILRGDQVVSSMLGAFGNLSETRITSLLGYIIANSPQEFCDEFSLPGTPLRVFVENVHEKNEGKSRSDIILETSRCRCVVEAKVGPIDPSDQVRKYYADRQVLLTNYPPLRCPNNGKLSYVRWQQIAKRLSSVASKKRGHIEFLCNDIIQYMQENNMIKNLEPVEVYARDIGHEHSFKRFFEAHIYYAKDVKKSVLSKALYFAPHFSKTLSKSYPGIRLGISYLARIEFVETVSDWNQFRSIATARKSKRWLATYKELLKTVKKDLDQKPLFILFLSTPRMVFNPPLRKEYLQPGRGYLAKRFYSFEELFAAWDGEKPAAKKQSSGKVRK